jgi:hypothetical protein
MTPDPPPPRQAPATDPGSGDAPAPSLCVQTILFRPETKAFVRFLESMSRSCELAIRRGLLGSARLAVGDCSPEPTDGASDIVGRFEGSPFDAAQYSHFGDNLGFAGGHNELFGDLKESIALVVNPDTYASPRLVGELLTGMQEDSVGIVEARQLPLEHPKSYDPGSGDTSWASGACFAVRAEVVGAIGGFDPELFFMYCEDVDFSWRTRLAGWRVVHRPSATVFHDKRLTADAHIEPGMVEVRFSAHASVVLPWRYGRKDVALEALAALELSADETEREVAAEMRRRVERREMPDAIEGASQVAQFVDGNYATNRFSYAEP